MKAICYYRFSTANKAQWDNSEKRQKETCTKYCLEKCWPIVEEVTDMARSGLLDKPSLQELEQKVRRGEIEFDVLVVDDLARLSRRTVLLLYKDIGWIDEFGIRIYIINSGGEPLTFEEIGQDPKMLLDQWANNREVKETSRKVSNGMLAKFNAGTLGWIGQAPLGYDLIKEIDGPSHLVANEDLVIVRDVFKHILDGGSIRDGVKILCQSKRFKRKRESSEDVRDPSSTSVKNLLRNPIYCGKRTFGVRNVPKMSGGGVNKSNPKWTKDNPLTMTEHIQEYNPTGFITAIEYGEWLQVQSILDNNKRIHDGKGFRRKAAHKYHQILCCGNCGAAMVQDQWKNPKTGKVHYTFLCNAAKQKGPRCREVEPYGKRIRKEEIDALVRSQVVELFFDRNTHIRMIEQYLKMIRIEASQKDEQEDYLDIGVMKARAEKMKELWFKTQSESLWKSIEDIHLQIDRREKELQETPQNINVLEIARRQWERAAEEGGFQSYLGHIYGAAYLAHKEPDRWKTKKGKQVLAAKVVIHSLEVTLKADGTLDCDDPTDIPAFRNAEACVEFLRDLGCQAINVKWKLGVKRGKVAWVADGLDLEFSVGISNHTDIRVVISTDHPEVMKLA